MATLYPSLDSVKFIVKYCESGTYLGSGRPVASKKAARTFFSREEATRVAEFVKAMTGFDELYQVLES